MALQKVMYLCLLMLCIQIPCHSATTASEPLTSPKCENTDTTTPAAEDEEDTTECTATAAEEVGPTNTSVAFSTPAQDRLQKEIVSLNAELHALDCRSAVADRSDEYKTMKMQLQHKLKGKTSALRRKQKEQERQKKHRLGRKRKFEELCQKEPSLRKELKMQPARGRPSLDKAQPELLSTIVDIATHGCAADDRRRSDNLRSVKTLDDLTAAVVSFGYNISRSGVYLRLLPRRSDTQEGKRHVNTVPVKLTRAQTESHQTHIDGKFAMSTMANMEELASVLGPQEVCFLSQDDKARVPIGITAASKQPPLLMHVDYKVSLPDHDWVVAGGHKLIPSVYAGIEIKPAEISCHNAVRYSGPTYIAIRSGKHSSSTAQESIHRQLPYLMQLTLTDFCNFLILLLLLKLKPDTSSQF